MVGFPCRVAVGRRALQEHVERPGGVLALAQPGALPRRQVPRDRPVHGGQARRRRAAAAAAATSSRCSAATVPRQYVSPPATNRARPSGVTCPVDRPRPSHRHIVRPDNPTLDTASRTCPAVSCPAASSSSSRRAAAARSIRVAAASSDARVTVTEPLPVKAEALSPGVPEGAGLQRASTSAPANAPISAGTSCSRTAIDVCPCHWRPELSSMQAAVSGPGQAARRRTSQTVAAMSSTDSASSQPPSIH
jgi:hypothetical protein